jgi:FKBP-type peptidyl-prolyl cis-trans isomerase
MISRWLAALLLTTPIVFASCAHAQDKPAAPAPAPAPAAKPAAEPAAPAASSTEDLNIQFSYLQGVLLGKQLAENRSMGIIPEQFLKGISDGSAGKADFNPADAQLITIKWQISRLDSDIAKAEAAKDTGQLTMAQEQKKMLQAELARFEQGVIQAKAGVEFLKKNATAEGVKVTPSGLQYQVIKQGTGPKPGPTDTFTASYKGTLINGDVFDQSKEGDPLKLGVNQVIPGWTEGLQLMNVGSKYKLWIPSNLGYGERGAGPKIPPNSVLIFELELLNTEAAPGSPGAPSMKSKGGL